MNFDFSIVYYAILNLYLNPLLIVENLFGFGHLGAIDNLYESFFGEIRRYNLNTAGHQKQYG